MSNGDEDPGEGMAMVVFTNAMKTFPEAVAAFMMTNMAPN